MVFGLARWWKHDTLLQKGGVSLMYSTAEEQIQDQQKYNQQEETFRLATVTGLFENGSAKVTFYGEEAESGKEYSYLASYFPTVNDKVIMARVGNSWVIMGRLMYDEIYMPTKDYYTKTETENLIEVAKGEVLDAVDDDYLAIDEYTTEKASFVKKNTNGTVTLNTEYGTSRYSTFGNMEVSYFFQHGVNANTTMVKYGVFGASPKAQQQLLALGTGATLTDVVNKVNEIITKEKNYGFYYGG